MTSFMGFMSFAFVFTEKNKALPLWLLSILHGEQGKGLTRLIPGLIPWPSDLKHSKQTTSNSLIPNEKDGLRLPVRFASCSGPRSAPCCRSPPSTSCILQGAFVSALALGITAHCGMFVRLACHQNVPCPLSAISCAATVCPVHF